MQQKKNAVISTTSKWKRFFVWLAGLNVVGIILPQGFFWAVLLQAWLKPGVGYEYMILGFSAILVPLFFVGLVVTLLNAIVIPVYLLRKKPKLLVVISGLLVVIASVVYFGFFAFQTYQRVRLSIEMNRILSKAETIDLINDCQITKIIEQAGFVHLTPVEGYTSQVFKDWYYRTAEKGSFNDLRFAADAVRPKCGDITLGIWSDPQHIPISAEEATELINNCDALGFYYYTAEGMAKPSIALTTTGALTRDTQTIPTYLRIPSSMVDRLLPVAKAAQAKCPNLTIWRDTQLDK
jgi:hypothetical protein